ncbi:hypothetical protein [Corynebacterium sp. A21]|uniref:hypothetical protein n=1 Tax=Corynebacterium sp. A21 TaxID=3457318 RepID=UPI003FD46883
MMNNNAARKRRLGVGAVVAVLAAGMTVAASISLTEAQRSASQFAQTEFSVIVEPVLDLEGSTTGVTWGDSTELTFVPDQMALQVGEENAVYTQLQVRAGTGSNTGATAAVRETGLSADSGFAASLRGEIFAGVATCDAEGVAAPGVTYLTLEKNLRGQESSSFDIAAPNPVGEAGAATQLCVKVWLNNNNWLLGGTTPPTETATWTVTGTSQ